MSINTEYYGAENSWVNIPMSTDMTDTFMLGQYADVSQSTYGLVSRTWLATKYGMTFDTYKQPLDNSYGFCITDGNAPFDNIMYCTGYNNNYPNRIKTYNKGKSTVGFAGYGYSSPYVKSEYAQYYKTSATGSGTYNNVPLNYNPPYPFIPDIDEYSNGIKIMRVANGVISPALKYNFGNYYVVPYIYFYVLSDNYTIADVDSVTNPSNYASLFAHSYASDLRRFYNDVTGGVLSADKIVISSVCAKIYHIAWNNDGTYDINNVSGGTTSSTTLCTPIPFLHSDHTTDLTFTEWYKTTGAESITVNIDTSFIAHQLKNLGTSVRLYNGKTGINTTGTVSNVSVISGARYTYGALYDNLTSYPYNIMPCVYDDDNYTVKWFEDNTSLSNTQKYSVAVYASLASFGGIDAFREYVRKSVAFLGCYFSECLYPNATKDWNSTDCFIGTIDDDGVTHGDYTNGTDNDNQRQKTWDDVWSNKTPYNPNSHIKPTAPTTEKASDPLTLRPNANIGVGMGLMRYAVKSNDLFNMGVWLNVVTNYNKAVNSFVSKYVTDNPTASENKAMKAFKNVFPDVNSWYAYVYSKLGNGVHPNNNIVGLMAFPFETNRFGVDTATGIKMGDSNTGSSPQFECKSWYEDESPINTTFTLSDITTATGKPVNSDGFAELEMGNIEITPEYGDFRDYAPYTKLELQIPYFGTVNLDPKEWYYHTVYVKCICECVTGSALCIVCRGDNYGNVSPVITIGGQVGFSIPLNIDTYGGTTASLTSSSASFQNMNVEHRVNAVNGLIDVGKSTASLIGAGAFTVATGGLGVGALALAGANTTQKASSYYGQMKTEKNNIKATEYAMEHQQAGSMILGSASPSANAKYEYQCRLVKHYPCMLNTSLSEFIVNNGVACNESGVVGDYSGYTVFSNVKLDNINLTDDEKKIIETTLQSGVYI